MQQNANPYRIYIKSTRQWIEVPEEIYRDHIRFCDACRKRHQEHGQCTCPRVKFWLCDGDCLVCEFHRGGDHLSLNYGSENEDGGTYTMLDGMAGDVLSIEDIICDRAELALLLARLEELMPEAIQIGRLRQDGLSDAAIANILGVKRTTFLSRLKKVKQQLIAEFPDLF